MKVVLKDDIGVVKAHYQDSVKVVRPSDEPVVVKKIGGKKAAKGTGEKVKVVHTPTDAGKTLKLGGWTRHKSEKGDGWKHEKHPTHHVTISKVGGSYTLNHSNGTDKLDLTKCDEKAICAYVNENLIKSAEKLSVTPAQSKQRRRTAEQVKSEPCINGKVGKLAKSWFNKLTEDQRREYLELHPHSSLLHEIAPGFKLEHARKHSFKHPHIQRLHHRLEKHGYEYKGRYKWVHPNGAHVKVEHADGGKTQHVHFHSPKGTLVRTTTYKM